MEAKKKARCSICGFRMRGKYHQYGSHHIKAVTAVSGETVAAELKKEKRSLGIG